MKTINKLQGTVTSVSSYPQSAKSTNNQSTDPNSLDKTKKNSILTIVPSTQNFYSSIKAFTIDSAPEIPAPDGRLNTQEQHANIQDVLQDINPPGSNEAGTNQGIASPATPPWNFEDLLFAVAQCMGNELNMQSQMLGLQMLAVQAQGNFSILQANAIQLTGDLTAGVQISSASLEGSGAATELAGIMQGKKAADQDPTVIAYDKKIKLQEAVLNDPATTEKIKELKGKANGLRNDIEKVLKYRPENLLTPGETKKLDDRARQFSASMDAEKEKLIGEVNAIKERRQYTDSNNDLDHLSEDDLEKRVEQSKADTNAMQAALQKVTEFERRMGEEKEILEKIPELLSLEKELNNLSEVPLRNLKRDRNAAWDKAYNQAKKPFDAPKDTLDNLNKIAHGLAHPIETIGKQVAHVKEADAQTAHTVAQIAGGAVGEQAALLASFGTIIQAAYACLRDIAGHSEGPSSANPAPIWGRHSV